MAVGASKPTVVADADGFFSVKSKMLVSLVSISSSIYKMMYFTLISLLIGRPYKDSSQISKAFRGISLLINLYRLYHEYMSSWGI